MALRPTPGRRLASLALSGAGHAAVCWLATLSWDAAAGHSVSVTTAAPAPEIVAVTRDELDAALSPAEESLAADQGQTLAIDGIDFNLDKIGARRNELFPFLTLDLTFVGRLEARAAHRRRRLANPLSTATLPPAERPPLVIGPTEMQQLVDRTWSRRERWRPFAVLAAMAREYDANHGQMPAVLQAFTDQNLLQPYYDTSARDPRFWTMLGLAADHAAFIAFTRAFARAHPSSRVTTELLFLLEELAHGSRDTLLMLRATDPRFELQYTRAKSPPAYELALTVKRHYDEWLEARRLDSPLTIGVAFDRIRVAILSAIVESTPQDYRASDARYLAGVILFEQNDLAGAMHWWRAMRPQPGDSYAEAATRVLEALTLPESRRAAALVAVLGAEHGKWLELSEQRLRQFGHAFDTY